MILWRVIQLEFLNSNAAYLCNGSRTFRYLWVDRKAEIIDLAKRFLDARADKEPLAGDLDDACLFYSYDDRAIRVAFLKWVTARAQEFTEV